MRQKVHKKDRAAGPNDCTVSMNPIDETHESIIIIAYFPREYKQGEVIF